MDYQWYPGHMTKAVRMMKENLQLIDLIIEIVDARLPLSSRNPDIDALGKGKFRLLILNKVDLADNCVTALWKKYFEEKGIYVLEINSKEGKGIKDVKGSILKVCEEKIARDLKRGIKNRPIRAMIVGIPNVGKSTFINSYTKKAVAKTGNKPGVTKGKQWIHADNNLELLDTPGILWPKFEDRTVGMRLAFVGSINDEIIVKEELALELIKFLTEEYKDVLNKRYNIETGDSSPLEILEKIARARMCFLKGEEIDYVKAASILFDDFRGGKLGRISLERP